MLQHWKWEWCIKYDILLVKDDIFVHVFCIGIFSFTWWLIRNESPVYMIKVYNLHKLQLLF